MLHLKSFLEQSRADHEQTKVDHTFLVFVSRVGHKIPAIENLGAAGPQDAIDFTDNDIAILTNFPLSPRLNTLLCARNRIGGVDKKIAEQMPNLTTLVLTANHVKELADLEGLSGCARLTHLSLLENPVTRKEVSLDCFAYW